MLSRVTSVKSKPSTITHHHQTAIQQANHLQQVHHPGGNIILVRGRSENGHIILQNSHELLSLLNGDDENNNGGTQGSGNGSNTSNKTILFQSQRIKAINNSNSTTKFESVNNLKNTILLHQPGMIKSSSQSQENGTILLQTSTSQKKNPGPSTTATALSDGSILLHPRVTRNNSDGPILLQTLKRLDKSQPILVFRNSASGPNNKTVVTNIQNPSKSFSSSTTKGLNCIINTGENAGTILTKLNSTTTLTNGNKSSGNSDSLTITTRSSRRGEQQLQNMSIVDEAEETVEPPPTPQRQSQNIPLGTGKWECYNLSSSQISH